ncbi:hypothetical protein ACHAXN_001039 [Cyclotella atomus]
MSFQRYCWTVMVASCLLISRPALAFQFANHVLHTIKSVAAAASSTTARLNAITNDIQDSNSKFTGRITTSSNKLYESLGLTTDEKTVVNIHRVCSPSVVYVASVLKQPSSRQRRQQPDANNKPLPRGTALGSGSGFIIDTTSTSHYIITNYHVIQRAYEANQMKLNYETFLNNLSGNITKVLGQSVESAVNRTLDTVLSRRRSDATGGYDDDDLPAQVYVRFGSNDNTVDGRRASYFPCEIVNVVKELDVAVLRMDASKDNDDGGGSSRESLPAVRALKFGQSSDLLVGQTLLAIGNPFGLDRTITSGIVSALGRSVSGVAGNAIKNCIQTDASINPGNSGGPLLNMKGEVVGVNTMIISTSGSSAGIGFAVPSDSVRDSTESIIDLDKEKRSTRKRRGWLGIDVALGSLESSLRKRVGRNGDKSNIGAFVTSISKDSPLKHQSESSIEITTTTDGKIQLGDRVINLGGVEISSGMDLVKELKQRVEGEKILITVESNDGEKKVVDVTLSKMPM